jgi:hypothetical protein
MGWTKLKLVRKAFGAMGLVEYDGTDMPPEMQQDGLSSLEAMMGQLDAEGIRLGYPLSDDPDDIDPNQDSKLPSWAVRAVYMNLAVELGASLSREVPSRVVTIASQSREALGGLFAKPEPYRMPSNIPAGAGHKGWPTTGFSILDMSVDDEDDLESGPDTVDSDLDFS